MVRAVACGLGGRRDGEHEADHDQGSHGLGHFWQVLVVPGQQAPASEPAECALLHLPARQKDKALCSPRTADDKQREAEQEAGQYCWHAVVAAVVEQPMPSRRTMAAGPSCS